MEPLRAVEEWTQVLDLLESHVEAAERAAANPDSAPARHAHGGPEWTEPTPATTIPAELVERARALLRRQHEASTRLAEQIASLRATRDRARTRPQGNRVRRASAYVDLKV